MFIDHQDPLHGVQEGASLLQTRWGLPINAAVIAGSGFSSITDVGTVVDRIPYSSLSGLPHSNVHGHGSELVLLSIPSGTALVFTGRAHAYEGVRPSVCASHVALAIMCGARHILLTNACGGLHPSLRTGDVVIPTGTVNLTHRSISVQGVTSVSPIDTDWSRRITDTCWSRGLPVRNGVYAQVLGPSYETRAEIRMLRKIGADTVGMSTAVEAQWAALMGAHVGIVSLVTNTLTDARRRAVTHGDVVQTAEMSRDLLTNVVQAALTCRSGM
ncbi:MAG TPA: purine-nucleoside phosphorylase [Candidatus Didemnitutus sp.]|nr:purine-nucleoside phosphorylase [Candidatus Didemnitutus sp.]